MHKVTSQIVGAFRNGKSLKIGNTSTDGTTVFLHGNAIFRYNRDTNDYSFTLAGCNTVTTRERINGCLNSLCGPECKVFQLMGKGPYFSSPGGVIELQSSMWYSVPKGVKL